MEDDSMFKMIIKGKVWKFGDNIDTDLIAPGKYLALPLDKLKSYAMEPIRPEFSKKVCLGDIIVAGKNFGCGSSRLQAPLILKTIGISAIIAESFARIFFRNSISIGMPVLQCEGITSAVGEGDLLEVNIKIAQVKNLNTGQILNALQLSKQMLDILKVGGSVLLLKKRFSLEC